MSTFRFHITFNMVFFGLLNIIERFPSDHVGTTDGGCAYVSSVDGVRLVPSCIVGQFFSDLGLLRMLLDSNGATCGLVVTSEYGNTVEKVRNAGAFTPDLRNRLAAFGITMDDDAHALLWKTQVNQDDAEPWPVAFEHALGALIDSGDIKVVRPEVSSVDLVRNTLTL